MTDKTHQLIGITAAIASYVALVPNGPISWPIATAVVIGTIIGSVAPDIDQPTASLWDEIPFGKWLGRLTARALGGHRNLSHSLLGVVLFTALMGWLTRQIPSSWPIEPFIFEAAAVIGFIAHLVADAVTVMGIPVFWPFGANMGFPPRPFHGIRIITGGWFENLIVLPVTTVTLFVIVWIAIGRFCLQATCG